MPLPFLLPFSNPFLLLNEARKSEEMMIRGNPWEEERRSKEEERRSEEEEMRSEEEERRSGSTSPPEQGSMVRRPLLPFLLPHGLSLRKHR